LTEPSKEHELRAVSALFPVIVFLSIQPNHALAQNWRVYTNVPYGSDPQETLDFYRLNTGTSNPVMVLIHGGGWGVGDKSSYGTIAARWASNGYDVAVLNYRLAVFASPTDINQWNAALQDVQLAVRFMRYSKTISTATYNYIFNNINPSRIGALGDSAGGQLALFLGSGSLPDPVPAYQAYPSSIFSYADVSGQIRNYSSKVQVVVDEFGPSKLDDANMYAVLYGLAVFGGRGICPLPGSSSCPAGTDPQGVLPAYRNASPYYFVTAQNAPTCIVQGTRDSVIPQSQSTELYAMLGSFGVPRKYISYNGDHEFVGLSTFQQYLIQLQEIQFVGTYLRR
jgi:acetyl esterase/lipase